MNAITTPSMDYDISTSSPRSCRPAKISVFMKPGQGIFFHTLQIFISLAIFIGNIYRRWHCFSWHASSLQVGTAAGDIPSVEFRRSGGGRA